MPRFGVKSILVVFAVVALWCSTFSDYAAAGDVRRTIVFFTLVISILLAYWSERRQKVFWLSFAIVIVPMGCGIYYNSQQFPIPLFHWITQIFGDGTPKTYNARIETIRAFGALLFATVAGYSSLYIYDQ